jgi:hypothetical protein
MTKERRAELARNLRHTPKGRLAQIYSKQIEASRLRGHPLPEYTREEFYETWLHDPTYLYLFDQWQASGFKKDLSPSFDREDPNKGYSLDNIALMTWGMNKGKASFDQMSKATEVMQYDMEGNFVARYPSVTFASKATGISAPQISRSLNGYLKQTHGFRFAWLGEKKRWMPANATTTETDNG